MREGRDLTLVSWGALLEETLEAAEILSGEGIEAAVIDVATLKPFDAETVLTSVARTGRCVIAHEAPRTGGFGAEIAAVLAEEGLFSLLAPVQRVTAPDVRVPLPRLEPHYLPGTAAILAAARRAVATDERLHLPDLGEGLKEAEIVTWHVGEGDHVVADQSWSRSRPTRPWSRSRHRMPG